MQARPSSPILPLTTIRFFAAFYVVLFHSFLWSQRLDTSTWTGRFERTGYTAVGFFFVLSGFILAHVYLSGDRPQIDRRKFWTSRFARAYPLLFVSLLLDIPNAFLDRAAVYGARLAAFETTLHLGTETVLLQSLDSRFRALNAPSWSLSAEAFFYFVFPFAALWIWRRKGISALCLTIALWAFALIGPIAVTLRHPALFVQDDTSRLQQAVEIMPFFRIFEFFAGISLCAFQASGLARLSEARRSRIGHLCLLGAAVLFVVAIQVANHVPLLVMSNGFLFPIYAFTILGLVNVRGPLAHLLSLRPLVILGEASYAVYLLHSPIWFYFARIHKVETLPAWLLYVAIVLSLSIASFFLLERPARRLILARAAIRPSVPLNQEAAAL